MARSGGGKELAGDGSTKMNGNRVPQGTYRIRLIEMVIRILILTQRNRCDTTGRMSTIGHITRLDEREDTFLR